MRLLVTLPKLFAVALVMLIAGGACSGSSDQSSDNPNDYEVREVPARWSTSAGADLSTLVRSSDVVFVGTVNQRIGQRNESPDPVAKDRSGLADKLTLSGGFPVSEFEIRVDQPLTGDLVVGQTITMEQIGGRLPSGNGDEILLVLEGDTPLAPGQRYLFFANVKENGAFAAAPYARLPIVEGTVSAAATWSQMPAVAAVDGRELNDAIEKVRNAR